MPQRDVDNIQNQFESGRRGQTDFNAVTRQIQDLQRANPNTFQEDLARINQNVDMRRLGFPEDFVITGVRDGRVQTMSADGRTRQERNAQTLELINPGPSSSRDRQIQQNPDGSFNYTLRPGDTLSHLVREHMRQQNGQTPSEREVMNGVREIARANQIADPNRVAPGTELRIPREVAGQPQPGSPERPQPQAGAPERPQQQQQGLRPDAPALQLDQTRGNHPLLVPGLGQEGRGVDFTERARTNASTRTEGERQIERYDSWTGGRLWGNTTLSAERETDRNTGRLLSSRVYYQGTGASFDVYTGQQGGRVHLENVRDVQTVLDRRTGGYTTTFNLANGQRYVATTDGQGQVTDWRQSR